MVLFSPQKSGNFGGNLDFEEVRSSLKVKNKLKSSAGLLDGKSTEWQNTKPTNS